MMDVHHPSCPRRHDTDAGCLCGPEAQAVDAVILAERTPDTMLLDVVSHADAAAADAWLAFDFGDPRPGPISRRMARLLGELR